MGVRGAEREVGVAEEWEETVIAGGLGAVRCEGLVRRTERVLRFLNGLEVASRKERDDDGAEVRVMSPSGDEDGLAQDVGVDLVEPGVLLGDAAAVDNAD